MAQAPHAYPQASVTVVSWDDITSTEQGRREHVQQCLREAFAEPDALGVIAVEGVPELQQRRGRLLPLAAQLAGLGDANLERYVVPATKYNIGWSRGKESTQPGERDLLKGSFYANPVVNEPHNTADPERNVWPAEDLPELEPALVDLGRLMCHVATELLCCCEQLLRDERSSDATQPSAPHRNGAQNGDVQPEANNGAHAANGGKEGAHSAHGKNSGHLWKAVEEQRSNKARLLHYYPVPQDEPPPDAWCGWHVDHGTLTGLTAAMFLPSDKPPSALAAADEVPCPDSLMGLHVRTCGGAVVRVSAKPHQLLFQAGQCLQALSGGRLKATQHYVRGPSQAVPLSRETFAVFCQPNMDETLDPLFALSEEQKAQLQKAVPHWRPGIAFAEFARQTVSTFYS